MKKYFLISLLIYLVFSTELSDAQTQKILRESALQDLQQLKEIIFNYHPRPWFHLSQETWLEKYQEVYEHLKKQDAISQIQLLRLMTPLTTQIRDEHIELFLSSELWKELSQETRFFPFEVDLKEAKKIIIRKAHRANLKKYEGKEIQSINGLTSAEIIRITKERASASSDEYFKGSLHYAFSQDNFRRFFKVYVDASEDFRITFTDTQEIQVKGALISGSKKKISFYSKRAESTPIYKIRPEEKIAYFRISTFMPSVYNSDVGKEKKRWLRFFEELEKLEIQTLSIDIRGNPGGTPFLSSFLASFFYPKPYQPFNQIYAREKTRIDFPKIFKKPRIPSAHPEDPSCILLNRLKENFLIDKGEAGEFGGDIVLLTDSVTGSAASIFTSLMRDHPRVKILGGETLGAANHTTGGQYKTFILNNSGLELSLPLLIFDHSKKKQVLYGVKPNATFINEKYLIPLRE